MADEKPPPPQDYFDRLQQELDNAAEDVVCKLELMFDPSGKKVRGPVLYLRREEGSVYEQLVDHLKREGCSPGSYRIRLRFAPSGQLGPQSVEPIQFAPGPAYPAPVAPSVAPSRQQVAPAGGAGPSGSFAQVAQTLKDFRRVGEEISALMPEPEEEDDEDDDLEDDEDPDEEDLGSEEPEAAGWVDKAKEEAAKAAIPLAVELGGALVELLKAVAKRIVPGDDDGDAKPAPKKAAAPTISGPEALRPAPASQPVELVPDDDGERAAS